MGLAVPQAHAVAFLTSVTALVAAAESQRDLLMKQGILLMHFEMSGLGCCSTKGATYHVPRTVVRFW